MKIAIMGAGGVGGYFGAKLALTDNDVVFIARGAHLAAIQNSGLKVETDTGDLIVKPAKATNHPDTVGIVDAVLFTTKLYDTVEAATSLKPIMGPDTFVVTLQNGISGPDMIGEVLGKERVLGGATYVISHLVQPGVIRHRGHFQRIIFGELGGQLSERARSFERACAEAGIDVELTDDVVRAMWEKFIPLSVMSGMTSLTRLPHGPIFGDPGLAQLTNDALEEVIAVGRAMNVHLSEDTATRVMKAARGAPDDTKSSMLVDLEHGRRLELPWLGGHVAHLGKALGVPTPTHTLIATILAPFVNGT